MSKSMGDTTLALALALEGSVAPASTEVERLVALAQALEAVPDPHIDPAFAAKLEARLMAEGVEEAPVLQIVKPAPRPAVAPKPAPVVLLPRRRFVVRKTLVAAIAAAMLMALPIAASANALPGSPFYAVKTWRQTVQLHFSSGAAKAFRLEQIARENLSDAAQLTTLGADPRLVRSTLDRAADHQRSAVALVIDTRQVGLITKMLRMIAADRAMLTRLQPAADGATRPAIHEAITESDVLSVRLARALGYPAAVRTPAPSDPSATQASASAGGTAVPAASSVRQPSEIEGAEAPSAPATPGGTEPGKPGGSNGTGRSGCGLEGDAGLANSAVAIVNTSLRCG